MKLVAARDQSAPTWGGGRRLRGGDGGWMGRVGLTGVRKLRAS